MTWGMRKRSNFPFCVCCSQATRVTALAVLQTLSRRGHPRLIIRIRIRVCWISWLKRNLTAKLILATNEMISPLVWIKLLEEKVMLSSFVSVFFAFYAYICIRLNIHWCVFFCNYHIFSVWYNFISHFFAHLWPFITTLFTLILALISFLVTSIYFAHSLCLENTLPL